MTSSDISQARGDAFQGGKHAQSSVIWAIIGFFVLGIIFGPIAISQAHKAERLGVPATFGKVLGWFDTIIWILGILSGIIAAIMILPNYVS